MKNTKDFTEQITSMFINGIKIKKIGIELGFHTDSIRKFLKRNQFKTPNRNEGNRKYEVNHNFFNKIDTEEKAYILGFLYADGYVSTKRNLIGLTLQESDIEIITKINKIIHKDKPLVFINTKKYHPGKNWQNSLRMEIASKQMTNDLVRLGCIPNKTYFLKFPAYEIIPEFLFHHFIRGFFDGDGCISISYRKKFYF